MDPTGLRFPATSTSDAGGLGRKDIGFTCARGLLDGKMAGQGRTERNGDGEREECPRGTGSFRKTRQAGWPTRRSRATCGGVLAGRLEADSTRGRLQACIQEEGGFFLSSLPPTHLGVSAHLGAWLSIRSPRPRLGLSARRRGGARSHVKSHAPKCCNFKHLSAAVVARDPPYRSAAAS